MNSMTDIGTDIDLASLADIVVADLAIMRRTGLKSNEALERGIELCERMVAVSLVSGGPPSAEVTPDASRKQLHGVGAGEPPSEHIDAEELARIKQQFLRLSEESGGLRNEELVQIQEFLVRATTSSWQERFRDFQQRRLKRGLKQQSLRDR